MDLVINIIVETMVYLVAYLIDWLRWWRFILSVLVAGMAAMVCYHFSANSNILTLMLALAMPVFGITVGIFWEYRTQAR